MQIKTQGSGAVVRLLPILLFLVAFSPAAHAGLVTWSINSLTFTDGGSATGWFQFDASTLAVGSYNIVVSGGNTANFPGLTYSSTTKTSDPYFNGFGGLYSFSFYDPSSTRRLIIEFAGSLPNGGGTVAIDAGASASGSTECFNCNPFRLATAGGSATGTPVVRPDITPTPEPGSLVLSALGAAGLLGLLRRRA